MLRAIRSYTGRHVQAGPVFTDRLAIAACGAAPDGGATAGRVAVAACVLDLGGEVPTELRLMPSGLSRARDGRPAGIPGWKLDAKLAGRAIEWAKAQVDDFVIDYEHQTLYSKQNGQPAPAAAWWTAANMEWRDGGLYATDVQWTPAAVEKIKNREYRYFSPVIAYDANTGDVLAITMGALTNYAAIDGLEDLAAKAAAKFSFDDDPEEDTVKREQLIKLLGLADDATNEQIQAALTALKADADATAEVRSALGVAGDASIVSTVTALKTQAEAGGGDPSKFVPLASYEALKGEVAELRGNIISTEVEALVKDGIESGRLLEGQKEWAAELGRKDIAALKGYLDKTPAIAALKGKQTDGKQKKLEEDKGTALTEAQLAICKATGVAPEDYQKFNTEEAH